MFEVNVPKLIRETVPDVPYPKGRLFEMASLAGYYVMEPGALEFWNQYEAIKKELSLDHTITNTLHTSAGQVPAAVTSDGYLMTLAVSEALNHVQVSGFETSSRVQAVMTFDRHEARDFVNAMRGALKGNGHGTWHVGRLMSNPNNAGAGHVSFRYRIEGHPNRTELMLVTMLFDLDARIRGLTLNRENATWLADAIAQRTKAINARLLRKSVDRI